jgi:hypothetical protein
MAFDALDMNLRTVDVLEIVKERQGDLVETRSLRSPYEESIVY